MAHSRRKLPSLSPYGLLLIGLATALGLYAVAVFHGIGRPLSNDEAAFFLNALRESGLDQGEETMRHQVPELRLYIELVAGALWLLGPGVIAARLVGVFAYLLGGLSTLALAWRCLGRRDEALLAALLFLCQPLVIQSSLLVSEEMVLVVALNLNLLSLLWLVHQKGTRLWPSLAYLASMAGVAACKPIWLPLAGCLALVGMGLGNWAEFKLVALHLALSLGSLALGWSLYAGWRQLPLDGPVRYALATGVRFARWHQGSQMLRTALWIPPLTLVYLAVESLQPWAVRPLERPAGRLLRVFFWATLLIFGQAVMFGFPRYVVPMTVPASLLIALGLSSCLGSHRECLGTGLLVVAEAALQGLLVGDPIYLVQYEGKLAGLDHNWNKLVFRGTLTLVVWAVSAIAAYGVMRWHKLMSPNLAKGALLAGLGGALALACCQAWADYSTSYGYGCRGLSELQEVLARNVPPGTLLVADLGIRTNYNLRLLQCGAPERAPAVGEGPFENTQVLESFLGDKRCSCMVFSPATNTLEQLCWLTSSPSLAELLNTSYVRRQVGSFTVYLRKV